MRKLLVFALLLVAAPAARAEEAQRPNLQVVEAAAPSIRQEAVVQAAVAEIR